MNQIVWHGWHFGHTSMVIKLHSVIPYVTDGCHIFRWMSHFLCVTFCKRKRDKLFNNNKLKVWPASVASHCVRVTEPSAGARIKKCPEILVLSQPNSTSTQVGIDKVITWTTPPHPTTPPTHPTPLKLLRHFQAT